MSERLPEFNRLELQRLLTDKTSRSSLVLDVKGLVQNSFPQRVSDGSLQLDDNYVESILDWSKIRISKLSDLVSKDFAFLWVTPSTNDGVENAELMKNLKEALKNQNISVEKNELGKFLREFAHKNGVAFSKFMKMLRQVLSGLKEGPGVAEMMEILGKDHTVARIDKFLSKIKR